MRSFWKLPSRPVKTIPVSSKTDPPLAKAELISEGGSASDNTLKKRKKLLHNSCQREELQYTRETALQTVQKEGQEVLQVPEKKFPCRGRV